MAIIPYYLVYFIVLFANGLVSPIIATLLFENSSKLILSTASFAFKDIIYSLCILLPSCSNLFSTPILSALSDYINRKYCLLFCLSFNVMSYFLMLIAFNINSIALLLFSRFCFGFSGTSIALAQAEILSEFPDSKVEKLSITTLYATFGFFAGNMVAGLFTGKINAELTLSMAFIIGMTMTLLASVFLMLSPRTHIQLFRTFSFENAFIKINREIILTLRDNRVLRLCIVFIIMSIAWNTQMLYAPFYLAYKLHLKQTDIAIFFIFFGINMILSYLLLNKFLIKRYSNLFLLKLTVIATGLCAILVTASTHFFILLIAIPLLSFSYACGQIVLVAMITNYFNAKKQGRISGIINTLSTLSVCFSALLISVLSDIFITLPFAFALPISIGVFLVLRSSVFSFLLPPPAVGHITAE